MKHNRLDKRFVLILLYGANTLFRNFFFFFQVRKGCWETNVPDNFCWRRLKGILIMGMNK